MFSYTLSRIIVKQNNEQWVPFWQTETEIAYAVFLTSFQTSFCAHPYFKPKLTGEKKACLIPTGTCRKDRDIHVSFGSYLPDQWSRFTDSFQWTWLVSSELRQSVRLDGNSVVLQKPDLSSGKKKSKLFMKSLVFSPVVCLIRNLKAILKWPGALK